MKSLLGTLYGKSKKFEGVVSRYGYRKDHQGNEFVTVCLVNVTHRGIEYVEHVWLRDATPFLDDTLPDPGQRVAFTGTVDMFPKGSYEVDFHIVKICDTKRMKEKKKVA